LAADLGGLRALPVTAYVDGLLLARCLLQCLDQVDCVHMFGLLVRSRMNAGQDGFRDTGSKQKCDLT
jgi:hypothetical protein